MKLPLRISFDIQSCVIALKITAIIALGVIVIIAMTLVLNNSMSQIANPQVWLKLGVAPIPVIMLLVMPIYPAIFIKPTDETLLTYVKCGIVVLIVSAAAYFWLSRISMQIVYPSRTAEEITVTSKFLTGLFLIANAIIHGLPILTRRSTP